MEKSAIKKTTLIGLAFFATTVGATKYETPACYAEVPTSCSFNEMTLSLCNQEGAAKKLVFLMSQRLYLPGGNKFATADGSRICAVKGIQGTDPKKYRVTIE